MYNQASTPRSFLVLVGDSIRSGGADADERKIGTVEQVAQLRLNARERGRTAAIGWIAADPDAATARRVLAESYENAQQPDSAIAVLREALKRQTTALPFFRWQIPFIGARAGVPSSGAQLKSISATFTVDSFRRFSLNERFLATFGAITVAGQTGMPSLIDDVSALMVTSTPNVPGPTRIPMQYMVFWYGTAAKVAAGLLPSPANRAQLIGAVRGMDEQQSPQRDPAVPYVLYLGLRDTVFADAAKRWGALARGEYPELDALRALARHDTATAARLARAFPSPDSLRRAPLGMNGARSVARAEVLTALGDYRRAAETYESIDPARFTRTSPELGWALYVRSYLARGRLYEQLGERGKAISSYERFLAMWAEAEAPLQPQLREARESIARLRDATTVPVKGTVRGGQ
jgi:tetratricopeptide (TPR) repeat protein